MAVIFRTNTQPRLLVGRLMEYNIPFQMRDVIPNIFDHWIARNILTYIKIAMGNKDRKLFLQIMNRPKRYISRSMLTDPQVDLKKLKQETAKNGSMKRLISWRWICACSEKWNHMLPYSIFVTGLVMRTI